MAPWRLCIKLYSLDDLEYLLLLSQRLYNFNNSENKQIENIPSLTIEKVEFEDLASDTDTDSKNNLLKQLAYLLQKLEIKLSVLDPVTLNLGFLYNTKPDSIQVNYA